MTEIENDAQWVEAARKGSKTAFEQLVVIHMKTAYHAALGIVGNVDDALELSQDAFLRAFRAMGNFKPEAKFYPWFHRILRNVCFTHLKKSKRRVDSVPMVDDEENEWDFPADQPDPSENLERKELEEQVWEALQCLAPQDREILLLKDFKDQSYNEIAEALDIPIGTVMSRLFNARTRLRKKMSQYLNNE